MWCDVPHAQYVVLRMPQSPRPSIGMSVKTRCNWVHCCLEYPTLSGHKARPTPLLNKILELFCLFKKTTHWHRPIAVCILDIFKGCVDAFSRVIMLVTWWRTRTDSLHPSQGAGKTGGPMAHLCSRRNLDTDLPNVLNRIIYSKVKVEKLSFLTWDFKCLNIFIALKQFCCQENIMSIQLKFLAISSLSYLLSYLCHLWSSAQTSNLLSFGGITRQSRSLATVL